MRSREAYRVLRRRPCRMRPRRLRQSPWRSRKRLQQQHHHCHHQQHSLLGCGQSRASVCASPTELAAVMDRGCTLSLEAYRAARLPRGGSGGAHVQARRRSHPAVLPRTCRGAGSAGCRRQESAARRRAEMGAAVCMEGPPVVGSPCLEGAPLTPRFEGLSDWEMGPSSGRSSVERKACSQLKPCNCCLGSVQYTSHAQRTCNPWSVETAPTCTTPKLSQVADRSTSGLPSWPHCSSSMA